jgi:hypothetical protein
VKIYGIGAYKEACDARAVQRSVLSPGCNRFR